MLVKVFFFFFTKKKVMAEKIRRKYWLFKIIYTDRNRIQSQNHLVCKWTLNYPNWPNDPAVLWVLICMVLLTYVIIMSRIRFRANLNSIVTWMSRNALVKTGTLYEVDNKEIRTHNPLIHKWTLDHLAKLVKWLTCVVSTYLYGAFDCMLLTCHVRISELMYTL